MEKKVAWWQIFSISSCWPILALCLVVFACFALIYAVLFPFFLSLYLRRDFNFVWIISPACLVEGGRSGTFPLRKPPNGLRNGMFLEFMCVLWCALFYISFYFTSVSFLATFIYFYLSIFVNQKGGMDQILHLYALFLFSGEDAEDTGSEGPNSPASDKGVSWNSENLLNWLLQNHSIMIAFFIKQIYRDIFSQVVFWKWNTWQSFDGTL